MNENNNGYGPPSENPEDKQLANTDFYPDFPEGTVAENPKQTTNPEYISPREKVSLLSAEREQLINELQIKGHSAELRGRLDDLNHTLLGAQADLFDQEGTTGANPDDR